ncbi:PHD finger protein ALFIN-LIKE 6 isoform 2 [Zea mays]|uniref:PHD finger protein ALFIN-LIKE n=2 Tax=Zea mays TaxID=4577 RepID=A0A1D6G7C6_MAIZE|nr:PHD finger protein ALFIN-LIKE 6 isoform 2 [Zea mays]AQK99060.1 PHD finger protein ALFIN-LIKE 6 [Zea mays]|eukprot:XP_008654998.1 PHD finger protein isoform X2 [Zea mays]
MNGGGSGLAPNAAHTADEVFRDYKGRRAGMIKALTTDVERFFKLCDPGECARSLWFLAPGCGVIAEEASVVFLLGLRCFEKENLCLYGYPDETWEVTLPAEEVPPEIPEPALGINFARDGMNEKDWLALVAVHSDSWLLSVAFYFGARFGFDRETRRRLFSLINNMPTIFEVVTGAAKKQAKEKTPNSSSKSNRPSSKVSRAESRSKAKVPQDEEESGDDDEDEEADEHNNTLCGTCGTNDSKDQFWICCDNCEKWYHGKCVKITPARAEHIKQYKCPDCTNKRARA